ncbi:hypothetical protein Bca4012_049379 [Brassica carinata]
MEIPNLILEMESSPKVQEDTDQKIDPDLSVKHDDEAHEAKKTEEKQNATRASTLDTILKSLWKISFFRKELISSFTEDELVSELRDFILTHPMESNGVYDFLVTILDLLPRWNTGYEHDKSLKSMFEYAFEDLTFENILKVIRTTLMLPCDKEGCGKRNYVERVINTLPSVFTIALEWENNETEEEISATTSVLATEFDISEIYKYEGDSIFTKYRLVSMVCLCGDQYNCMAYENNRWIRYFALNKEVIGDWNSVLSSFLKLKIRPEILFFQNVSSYDCILACVFVFLVCSQFHQLQWLGR